MLGVEDAQLASAAGDASDADEGVRAARLSQLGVAVEPVVAAFSEARVRRTLENAMDREADATWTQRIAGAGDPVTFELWAVDDDSATARIGTLLAQSALTIEKNGAVLAAHARWWSERKRATNVDDDRVPAAAFALAFLHPVDDAWDVPDHALWGAVMAPLTGALA